jgi:TonB family protein
LVAGAVPGCLGRKPHAAKFMSVDLVVGRGSRATPGSVAGPERTPSPLRPVDLPPPVQARPTPPKLIKPIQVKPPSQKIPVRTAKQTPLLKDNGKRTLRPPKLSREQIEKELLNTASAVSTPVAGSRAASAVVGDAVDGGGSNDGDTYLDVVQQTFYDAWIQPSYSDVGDAEASISIELALDGAVTGRTLAKSSGNAILDASAMRAAETVQRISGLSRDFTAENRKITVQFKVVKE